MAGRILALAALLCFSLGASAQYPEKPPTIVVPFAFGALVAAEVKRWGVQQR